MSDLLKETVDLSKPSKEGRKQLGLDQEDTKEEKKETKQSQEPEVVEKENEVSNDEETIQE